MSDALLKIGSGDRGFIFSTSTAAYSELTRQFKAAWSELARVGRNPDLQFTGVSAETIAVRGTVYGAHAGGTGQLDTIRELAGLGEPLFVVSASGRSLGRWVIESVNETQTAFLSGGAPRKQEFNLGLKFYDDGTNL